MMVKTMRKEGSLGVGLTRSRRWVFPLYPILFKVSYHLLKEIYEEYVRNLTDDFSNPYSKSLIYLMQLAKANKVPLLIYQRSEGR